MCQEVNSWLHVTVRRIAPCDTCTEDCLPQSPRKLMHLEFLLLLVTLSWEGEARSPLQELSSFICNEDGPPLGSMRWLRSPWHFSTECSVWTSEFYPCTWAMDKISREIFFSSGVHGFSWHLPMRRGGQLDGLHETSLILSSSSARADTVGLLPWGAKDCQVAGGRGSSRWQLPRLARKPSEPQPRQDISWPLNRAVLH